MLTIFPSQLRKLKENLKLLFDYFLIRASGLFDGDWYLKNNPDVVQSRVDPVWHYLAYGGFEGRDPGPNFCSRWYLITYLDVQQSGVNPLVHYLKFGQKERRKAIPSIWPDAEEEVNNLSLIRSSGLFDEALYLKNNPDVVQANMDPVLHYLRYGGIAGRDLAPNFYSKWYLDTYDDVKRAGVNPLVHYLTYGQKEGRSPVPPIYGLSRMYDYSKKTNRIVYEDAPERIYLQRPGVIGKFYGLLKEGQAVCPRPYISVIEDAIIFGGENLVLLNGEIILSDELVDFNGKEFGKKSPHLKAWSEDTMVLLNRSSPNLYVKEGILLSCGHDNNYFHWLVECLPKLLLIDDLNLYKDAPLLIPVGLHKNLVAALDRVNVNNRPLIYIEPDSACVVERLIFPSALSRIVDRYEGSPVFDVDIVLSHKWIAKVGELLKKDLQSGQKPWRKLFLTRRKGLRALGNLEELELMLLEHGFEIVELDGASLDLQIKLFSQASIIVAPTGAALTNMLFCPPGTKVIIFMSNHETTNYYFWSNLGAVANLDVTIIAGERLFNLTNYWSVHDDYVIDPKLVLEEILK